MRKRRHTCDGGQNIRVLEANYRSDLKNGQKVLVGVNLYSITPGRVFRSSICAALASL